MSSAYHPQTDGQTEAMNRVVEMISEDVYCMRSRDVRKLGDQLWSIVEFVVNSLTNAVDGVYSPFFLNFGYHPCTPDRHPQGSRREYCTRLSTSLP